MLEVTASTVSYHRPISSRTGIGLLGVIIGAGCLCLLYHFYSRPDLFRDRSPADLGQIIAILLVPLFGLCGPTAIFLYEAGPLDLVINLSQRTYRFRRGFPLLASWQSGPLNDIADLRVETSKNKGTTYRTMLDWKNTKIIPWSLGDGAVSSRRSVQIMFSHEASQVHDEAQRLARLIDVPVTEIAPIWEEARRRDSIPFVLVPVILFLALTGLSPLLVAHELKTQGQTVQGRVMELRDGKGLSVRYTYQAGAHSFRGGVGVPASVYFSLKAGGPVSVRYLPAYPNTSTVVGARDSASSGPALLLAGICVFVLVASRASRSQ